jgi:hypothetical protein
MELMATEVMPALNAAIAAESAPPARTARA